MPVLSLSKPLAGTGYWHVYNESNSSICAAALTFIRGDKQQNISISRISFTVLNDIYFHFILSLLTETVSLAINRGKVTDTISSGNNFRFKFANRENSSDCVFVHLEAFFASIFDSVNYFNQTGFYVFLCCFRLHIIYFFLFSYVFIDVIANHFVASDFFSLTNRW